MKTIFVVDDSDTNLAMAEEALEDRYRVMTMSSAAKMFELLKKLEPDLILLDIEMPGMDGFEAMRRLKAHHTYGEIPVIFLTGRTDVATEVHGFEIGVVDFITTPFSAPVLLNRIKTHLGIDEIIQERTAQLRRLQNSVIFVLANMVESRDKATGGHIERTTAYIKILINAMQEREVYADEIRNWNFEITVSSARLHDVGKVIISDLILNKPGKLTDEEFKEMEAHTLQGEQIINQIIDYTGEEEFLHNAKLFAGYHHERWDGTGYPYGLKGRDIPLQGRIMAIVDAYDAIVSERPYKQAFTDDEAVDIIMKESGSHFDPDIAKVFYAVKDLFKEVSACLV
jgi:putative two-component system response regulator